MLLLTGGSGFIGSYFLKRIPPDFPTRCLVRKASAVKPTSTPSVTWVEGDMTNPDSVSKATEGVDTIVHLAGLTRTAKREDIFRVNTEGTRLLVEAAKQQGVKRLIFTSTENVLREDLNDAYAESKRQAEDIVRAFPNHVILRPHYIYGVGDKNGLGKWFDQADKQFFPPIFSGLKKLAQPLHVKDMAEYLYRAATGEMQGEYMIAGAEHIHLNDFLKKYCEIHHLRRCLVPVPFFVLKVMAFMNEKVTHNGGWSTAKIQNIYDSRLYPIDKTLQDFQYVPQSIQQALQQYHS
jgi:nucleoside-diphosphate-sugar epimerase